MDDARGAVPAEDIHLRGQYCYEGYAEIYNSDIAVMPSPAFQTDKPCYRKAEFGKGYERNEQDIAKPVVLYLSLYEEHPTH